ncbi:hypothetical protein [Nannocystis punicea]|uniref:YokE-like PH domain-containing protein n=1 Tax=Nannocystis punicea TaxID=2995304 RepID=A0ABY7HDW8_9BACT|nr:hypothetical protein [Nannocystis poenicansa]WAS97468.1 hypothetical protein O0S08_15080 [Nannocystis poenicansa]
MNMPMTQPQPPQGRPLSPAAQKMLAEVELLPGEVLHYSIQGDGFFLGSNPLVKAAAVLSSFLTTITGGHIRVFLFVTNMRILLLESRQAFCGFARIRKFNAIALASLAEAGSGKETQWCCIHTRTIHIESKTQRYTIVIKHLDDRALREFVQTMSTVMLGNAYARTTT